MGSNHSKWSLVPHFKGCHIATLIPDDSNLTNLEKISHCELDLFEDAEDCSHTEGGILMEYRLTLPDGLIYKCNRIRSLGLM